MSNSKIKKKQFEFKKTYTKRNVIIGILASVAVIYANVIGYIHADGYDIIQRYILSQTDISVLHINLLALFTLAYNKASQASRISARTYLWCVAGVLIVINMFTHALFMRFDVLNYLYRDCMRIEWVEGTLLLLLFIVIIRMNCLPEEDEYQKEIIK